jgi:hypothetical protein
MCKGNDMSELGDYRRLVEKPMIARYEATISSLRSENERLQEALQQLVDYVKDMVAQMTVGIT